MSAVIGSCDCGRTWTSHAEAHCAECHNHFTSNTAFDRHIGRGGCSDPRRFRDTNGDLVFSALHRESSGLVWSLRVGRENVFRGLRGQQEGVDVA